MKDKYYIFQGENPQEWSEGVTLGPFSSFKKAEDGLREECKKDFMNSDSIDMQDYENWFSRWVIMKVEKAIQPKPKLSLKLTLNGISDEEIKEKEALKESEEELNRVRQICKEISYGQDYYFHD